MANFNIPNLCGASPDLNGALDEINKLKDKLTANIDVDASALKADLESGLADLKGAFDKLEIELPEVPNINFQAEVTSLINDIDKTTVEGLAAFNIKLASLKLDFGDTLSDKGIDFDSLISSAETKLAGGGNVCDTVANLEIPAANSGTGVTTEEKEFSVSTGLTVIALPEDYKEIVSVQGRTEGSTFFGNISGYKVNGRIITIPKSFATVKIKYIISLITEKPIATKQASKDGEKEELSIVTTNTASVEKNVQGKITSLLKKIDVKGISGLATEKENAGIQTALGKLKDGSFKAAMEADIAKAKEEQKKILQDPLNYKRVVPPTPTVNVISESEVKSTQDSGATISQVPVQSKKTREVKVTTTENRNTVTTSTTTVETKSGNSITKTVPKTEKSTISLNGFAQRKVKIKKLYVTSSAPQRFLDKPGAILVSEIGSGIELQQIPFQIDRVRMRAYKADGSFGVFAFDLGETDGSVTPVFVEDSNPPKIIFMPKSLDGPSVLDVNVMKIEYTVLEKVDPNYKG